MTGKFRRQEAAGGAESGGEGEALTVTSKCSRLVFHAEGKEGSLDAQASILETSEKAERFTGC